MQPIAICTYICFFFSFSNSNEFYSLSHFAGKSLLHIWNGLWIFMTWFVRPIWIARPIYSRIQKLKRIGKKITSTKMSYFMQLMNSAERTISCHMRRIPKYITHSFWILLRQMNLQRHTYELYDLFALLSLAWGCFKDGACM